MGVAGLLIAVLLYFLIPAPEPAVRRQGWVAIAAGCT